MVEMGEMVARPVLLPHQHEGLREELDRALVALTAAMRSQGEGQEEKAGARRAGRLVTAAVHYLGLREEGQVGMKVRQWVVMEGCGGRIVPGEVLRPERLVPVALRE